MNPRIAAGRHRKSVLLAMGFYVHEINVGVAKFARSAGWILNDLTSRNGKVPPGWKGDGIIALLPNWTPLPEWEPTELIRFARAAKVPVVDLSDQLPELPFPRVLPDNEAIGDMAAQHLLNRGFEHFSFFTQDISAPVVRERMEGYRRAIVSAGRTFHLVDYTPHMREPRAMERLLPWLGRQLVKLPKPLAAMAQYDAEANDIVRACQLMRLMVPEQVAIIGADNDPIYAELGPIPLSSVDTDREALGYKGAELLDHLMRGGKPPPVPIRIPPAGVVVRQSSDIVAVKNIPAAKALQYITAHCCEPITVDDVAAGAGVSRRNLYVKFARYIGHSVQREIVRQRLERAQRLLREMNDEKLHAIATSCGFEDAAQFSKIFKHHLGISVSSFRALHRSDNAPPAPAAPHR